MHVALGFGVKLGFGGVWRGFVMHVGGELRDGDWDSGLKGWGLGIWIGD